jgi:hypothetical protein
MKELITQYRELESLLKEYSVSAYNGELIYDINVFVQKIQETETLFYVDASVRIILGLEPNHDDNRGFVPKINTCKHFCSLLQHNKRIYVSPTHCPNITISEALSESFAHTIEDVKTNTIQGMIDQARIGVFIDGKHYKMIDDNFPLPYNN